MTRHLSTIVEAREENVEEFNNADGAIQFGRGENRRRRFNRRVYSCNDIAVAKGLNEKHTETFTLPPLPNTTGTQKQALHGNRKGSKDNLNSPGRTDNIFPDFRPNDRNCSIDAKIGRHSTRPKRNVEGDFSYNKENIVASWLQFFG